MSNMFFTIRAETVIEFDQIDLLAEEIEEKLRIFLRSSNQMERYLKKVSLLTLNDPGEKKTFRRQYAGSGCRKGTDIAEILHFFSPGTKLNMVVEFEPIPDLDMQTLQSGVNEFAELLDAGKFRIGKNTTLGRGRCSCWATNTGEEPVETADLCDCIEVDAAAPEGFLIRSQDKNSPYIKDDYGRPIIPASTWKGIFRHAVSEWITCQEDDPLLLDRMFGNRSRGIRGCLIFYDSVIQDPEEIDSTRIYLDKLTGSAMLGELRENTYIAGHFSLCIECLEDMEPYRDYLYTVLRDLHWGRINVGADKGIGRGFIRIRSISYNGKEYMKL